MAEEKQLREQINAVVEAREKALLTKTRSLALYGLWQKENQQMLDDEIEAKAVCLEAEAQLREMALQTYAVTGDKAVAPGIGIRMMTRLAYEDKEAMSWAMEHKLALKLDTSAFEKIAKTSNLMFVTISEEPQATIATELQKVE